MKRSILSRIEQLELRSRREEPAMISYGFFTKKLPDDYSGERHLAIVKREPTSPNTEWCEFEERAGPAPSTENGTSLSSTEN